ncbi:MAG: LysR family transcriptional regulator [Pseudooceanicola sp.]|nr:LysR family transcriptional regulator [Pseudooceanicola sp.]|tara:strand:- start:941 stop:1861 length:921 start_codon:yes stop_codon:yes gene_type:complete
MTTPVDPMSLDFNALRTLRRVHALGSFSRAAESLGTTQSTVSYTIDRLRRALGDPLFVRQGTGIVATDRCDEIAAAVARITDDFSALLEPAAFDPGQAEATITLSCNYYERMLILPGLLQILRRKAPGIRLNVLTSTVLGKGQLDRGESDLLISPVPIEDSGFFRRRLLREHSVCVMSPDNPLAGQPMTQATYLTAPHVTVIYGGSWQSRFLTEIEAQGLTLNEVLRVPSPAAVPRIITGTDLISTLPSRIARAFGERVHVTSCPFAGPFDIHLYWNARTHHSPMHGWLRSQIAETVISGGDIRLP